jgi:hypothetical protein
MGALDEFFILWVPGAYLSIPLSWYIHLEAPQCVPWIIFYSFGSTFIAYF